MERSRTAPVVGACVLGIALWLRQAGADGELSRPGFAERVDVTEVTLGVAVVDRGGVPIRGLRRDEFVLEVDGVPTPITSFSEGAPPNAAAGNPGTGAGAEPRHLAVLLNDRGGAGQERGRALRQLEELLPELQAQGWRISISAVDTTLHTIHAFADEPESAAARLRERGTVRALPSSIAAERQALLTGMDDISIGMPGKDGETSLEMDAGEARGVLQRIRALARAQRQQGRAMVALLSGAIDDLRRLPGTRCLVYVGEGFEAQPATDLFLLWAGRYPTVAIRELRKPELEAGQYSLATEIGELGAAAAAADVAVHYVPTSSWSSGASNDVDREGAETTSDIASSSRRSLGDALASLSRASGGARLTTGKRGLAALADELGARYTIAFSPPAATDRSAHRVSLSVTRAGARTRHRESFRFKSVAERMVEATLAALTRGDGPNPLEAAVERRDSVARGGGRVDLTLAVTVPMRNLALVPERSAHRGEVTIFYCASDGPGLPVEVRSLAFPVVLDNESLFTTLRQDASFPLVLTVAPATERIAVTILDSVSQTASTVTMTIGAGAGQG